jgi:ubiquitin C-terminal hydrolase
MNEEAKSPMVVDSLASVGDKSTATEANEKPAAKINYESVVNIIFDGQLISTVKCLICQHLSPTNETFQV